MDLSEIEAQLKKVKLVKEIEHAIATVESAIKHNAAIKAIVADDAAESERSINFAFTGPDSKAIFAAARDALLARQAAIMGELR